MSKIKITDKESCTLVFTHLNGKPAKLHIARNPLTGDWLQIHTVGEDSTPYVSDKTQAVKLVNSIVEKSKANNLPCTVEIKTLP